MFALLWDKNSQNTLLSQFYNVTLHHFIKKRREKDDSLHCRKAKCRKRNSRCSGSNGTSRGVYWRKRIPGDVDIRPPLHTQGTAWIQFRMENVEPFQPPHDSSTLRNQTNIRLRHRETIQNTIVLNVYMNVILIGFRK